MSKFVSAVKGAAGYVVPVWHAYVGFVAVHPRTAAVAILVLAALAIRI